MLSAIQDPELYSAFSDLFKKIIQYLSTLPTSTKIQLSPPDLTLFWILYHELDPTIRHFDEYKKFETLINKNKEYIKNFNVLVGTSSDKTRLQIADIIPNLLLYYLLIESIQVKQEIIDECYEDLEKFFLENKVTIRNMVPIVGLMNDDKIIFDDQMILRRFPLHLFTPFIHETPKAKNILIFKHLEPKIIGESDGMSGSTRLDVMEKMRALIVCFRLHKHGNIGTLSHIQKQTFSHGFSAGLIEGCRASGNYVTTFDGYTLYAEDIESIRNLLVSYKKIDFSNGESDFLKNAIDRFMYSYEKSLIHDKIIDLIIALEALFQDGNQEITFKLSIKTALFIEVYTIERNEVYNVIKKAYDLRSRVAHGDTPERIVIGGVTMTEQQLCVKLEEIVRRSIKKFIEDNLVSKRAEIFKRMNNDLFFY